MRRGGGEGRRRGREGRRRWIKTRRKGKKRRRRRPGRCSDRCRLLRGVQSEAGAAVMKTRDFHDVIKGGR